MSDIAWQRVHNRYGEQHRTSIGEYDTEVFNRADGRWEWAIYRDYDDVYCEGMTDTRDEAQQRAECVLRAVASHKEPPHER